MKAPRCKTCEKPVLYGNLYCSKGCEDIAKASDAHNADALRAHGFQADPETPNVWLKDGVATSIEHIRHIGVHKAIEHHMHAVASHRRAHEDK